MPKLKPVTAASIGHCRNKSGLDRYYRQHRLGCLRRRHGTPPGRGPLNLVPAHSSTMQPCSTAQTSIHSLHTDSVNWNAADDQRKTPVMLRVRPPGWRQGTWTRSFYFSGVEPTSLIFDLVKEEMGIESAATQALMVSSKMYSADETQQAALSAEDIESTVLPRVGDLFRLSSFRDVDVTVAFTKPVYRVRVPGQTD
jgi:hypothetical protein